MLRIRYSHDAEFSLNGQVPQMNKREKSSFKTESANSTNCFFFTPPLPPLQKKDQRTCLFFFPGRCEIALEASSPGPSNFLIRDRLSAFRWMACTQDHAEFVLHGQHGHGGGFITSGIGFAASMLLLQHLEAPVSFMVITISGPDKLRISGANDPRLTGVFIRGIVTAWVIVSSHHGDISAQCPAAW